jgi:hypothetical protein
MSDCTVASRLAGHSAQRQVVLVGCPKFDDVPAYLAKLTEIFRNNEVKRVTITHMEVPCCSGLAGLVQKAIKDAGKKTPLERLVLSVDGELL